MYDNQIRLFAMSTERLAIADLARASIAGIINLDSIVADISMSIVWDFTIAAPSVFVVLASTHVCVCVCVVRIRDDVIHERNENL